MNDSVYLGIECGGTRSVALLAADAAAVARVELGPANLRLLDDRQLRAHFRACDAKLRRAISTRAKLPLAGLCIGMAGARTPRDLARIRAAAASVWPEVLCRATSDLETALAAAEFVPEGQTKAGRGSCRAGGDPNALARQEPRPTRHAQVLVLSGTGSCCYGHMPEGRTVKVGGWGHQLGDRGSGYEIGLMALQGVLSEYDREGVWPPLGAALLRELLLNRPDDLIDWARAADKSAMAALAVPVFAAGARKDRLAQTILAEAATRLAGDAVGCARRLAAKGGTPMQFVLAGGNLVKQPGFARLVRRRLLKLWPGAEVVTLAQEGAWGAARLAAEAGMVRREHQEGKNLTAKSAKGYPLDPGSPGLRSEFFAFSAIESNFAVKSDLTQLQTERRNPRSMRLDRMALGAAVELMLSEEAKVMRALRREKRNLVRAIELITRCFKKGGRLFYVGAGTSGRLGVLDASECPPTFSTPPEMVQGIMAGGAAALSRSVERAEDDAEGGAEAIRFRGIDRRDVVVGIAASGRTPFVWGALGEARWRRATTILLCFNPDLKLSAADRPDLVIAPATGPEVLTGSTRLKAGTATKLVLNLFTTLAMVRLGKVAENLMVDLKPSNDKLRDRAVRIVQTLTGVDAAMARAALERSQWVIKRACARVR